MRQLQTATLANQNITSDLLVSTYTADADRAVLIRIVLDAVAGTGDYTAYLTLQQAGAGSAYKTHVCTVTAAAAVTAIMFPSILIPVNNTDVVKIYVKGLAGDTTIPDIITRFYELDYTRPTTPGAKIDISTTGEVGLDFSNIKAATGATTLTNITVPAVTTVGNVSGAVDSVTDIVTADMVSIHGAALTETTTQLAAAFSKFFDVASPAGTVNLIPAVTAVSTVATVSGLTASNLDATVSSRSIYAGGAVASVTGAVNSVATGVTLADDAITSAKFDESSAFPLKAADAAATQIARVGADADTLETLSDQIDGIVASSAPTAAQNAAAAWAYATRTLTQNAAQVTAAVTGSDLTVMRGSTYTATLTIPSTTGWTKAIFAAKTSKAEADTASLVYIVVTTPAAGTDGLLYLNGAVTTATNGSLVIGATSATITIKAAASVSLVPVNGGYYGVQVITATSVSETEGDFSVVADTVRAIA